MIDKNKEQIILQEEQTNKNQNLCVGQWQEAYSMHVFWDLACMRNSNGCWQGGSTLLTKLQKIRRGIITFYDKIMKILFEIPKLVPFTLNVGKAVLK